MAISPYMLSAGSVIAGSLIGYGIRALIGRWQADAVERQAQEKLSGADAEAARRLREADIQGRAEVVKAREVFEASTKTRYDELREYDARIARREENLELKGRAVEAKEEQNKTREAELDDLSSSLDKLAADLDGKHAEADARLEHIAGMTRDEARAELKEKVIESVRAETGLYLRRLREITRENAARNARMIVADAIERYAVPHAVEALTATVPIPSDETKARIVGREGRNILSFESVTGATLIVDGPPGLVVISCFNPVRREIARLALTMLVADGRIHPASIEEAVRKAQQEVDGTIIQCGREAAFKAKQQGLSDEVLKALGRLRFRTSYSQNVLEHSLEVSALMGEMADEMGLDGSLARRIGLLHDIGKSVSEEVEGGHAKIGADMLRRSHESQVLINAVESHHHDVERTSVYAVLCSAADAISASRPGARNESLAGYVHRLEQMEKIAKENRGVNSVYAIQSGHELRVIVDPNVLNDNDSMLLAKDIADRIEKEMSFPGQIRVTVVREQRCIEYAK